MVNIAVENKKLLRDRWLEQADRILSAPLPEAVRWVTDPPQPTAEVRGFRLWRVYDEEAKASLQAALIHQAAVTAWVSDIGFGDLIRALLPLPLIRQINVVWLNPSAINRLMLSLDHRDWLQGSKVELRNGADEAEPCFPFAVVPSCLQLWSDEAVQLRDRLVLELAPPFERERQKKSEPLRKRQIEQNLSLIESDDDVEEQFNTAHGNTAFVAIATPILQQTALWIQSYRNEGTLIAVHGALTPLIEMRLVPDFVVTADNNRPTILPYFSGDMIAGNRATLVYPPVVHHDVLTRCLGTQMAIYNFRSIYNGTRAPNPKGELGIAGSVAHITLELAVKIGAVQVVLFGADFGFPDGCIHANGQAPLDLYAAGAKAGVTKVNGYRNVVPTLASFNGYRLDLEIYTRNHPNVDFINTSREGAAIQGVPYLDEISP